ncbi:MAG: hypothetical protein HYY45_04090 [Deltaproteobacteria bacterium]|nr:hypothetical protein [Deltaproteobacteria bacterium]
MEFGVRFTKIANRTTSGPSGTFQNLSCGYDNDRTFTYDALNRLTQM